MTPIVIVLALPILLAAAVGLAFWTREKRLELDEPEIPEFQPESPRLERRIKSNEINWEI